MIQLCRCDYAKNYVAKINVNSDIVIFAYSERERVQYLCVLQLHCLVLSCNEFLQVSSKCTTSDKKIQENTTMCNCNMVLIAGPIKGNQWLVVP